MRLAGLLAILGLLIATSEAQVREGAELTIIDGSKGLQPIMLNTNVASTVTFPGKISLITGYGLVQEMGEIANFTASSTVSIVHYQRVAADTIVLRMLRSGLPCFMTVRTTEGFFLLKAEPAEEANLAVLVVAGDPSMQAVEMPEEAVVEQRIDYEPMALVGILSRAQQRAFLQTVNPELFDGWEERHDLELQSTSRGAEISIYEIQRWPEKDAIILRSMVTNPTNRPFVYDPKVAEVRVGNRVYPVQLADGPSEVAPGKRVALDLVLVGNPLGGKEHLAISNDFRIELPSSPSFGPAVLPDNAEGVGTDASLFGPKNPVVSTEP